MLHTTILLIACSAWTALSATPSIAQTLPGANVLKESLLGQSPDFTTANIDRVSNISRRAFNPKNFANDELWKKYVEKGNHFLCLMQATDNGAGFLIGDTREPKSAASPWSGDLKKELKQWFWHTDDSDDDECDFKKKKLQGTFEGLRLNYKSRFDNDGNRVADGANECFKVDHYDINDSDDPDDDFPLMKPVVEQKYKVDKTWYTATGAYFVFGMNKQDGAIIGLNLESPTSAATRWNNWDRPALPEELPALRHGSDIYMGYWIRDNPDVKKLRIYGAHNIVNEDTTLLVGRAFKNRNYPTVQEWPGHSFDTTTDEGKALLASPIGGTIAHMLIRHKAELGIKHITKVTIVTQDVLGRKFGSNYEPDFHLFFHIEDVPADEIPEDPKPDDKPGDKPGSGQADKTGNRIQSATAELSSGSRKRQSNVHPCVTQILPCRKASGFP